MRPTKKIKRTKKLTLSLTSLEILLLEELAKKSNFRKSILAREIVVKYINKKQLNIKILPKEIKELRYQLFKLGSNLNQLTKHINQEKNLSIKNQVILNEKLAELIEMIKQIDIKTK